ncbi:FAD-binding domain-containing protein [Loktanella agnita]
MFDPSHAAALSRLKTFIPKASAAYAAKRNYDDTTHVATLSPYIRHRIITEQDVLTETLNQHSPQAAAKFIQEVFWRTYWKGWLELRPSIWTAFRAERDAALNRIQTESGLRQRWEAACKGATGIDGFDHWAQQLAASGYLHNHARMWFASIWIFTLQLPWTLGADFFLRHLYDGDPASNTLSWRWVAGLQTKGKTYLADPENIATYTHGRFRPTGLASHATPLEGAPHPASGPAPISDPIDPVLRTGLLITEEDLSPDWLLNRIAPVATATVQTTQHRSPLIVAPQVCDFVRDTISDCTLRFGDRLGPVTTESSDTLGRWAETHDVQQIVTSYLPVGPTQDALRGLPLCQVIRSYDSAAWPHATHGYFRFRKQIPALLDQLGAA